MAVVAEMKNSKVSTSLERIWSQNVKTTGKLSIQGLLFTQRHSPAQKPEDASCMKSCKKGYVNWQQSGLK